MTVSSPTLPADVVRLALEAAYVTPDHTLWDEFGRGRRVAWFASMLQVSRTWYTAGLQALYHRIQIITQDERTNTLLIRTLSHKPHIAQMVKVLQIRSLDVCMGGWCTGHRIQLSKPSIPLVTRKGRKAWRKKRNHKKLVQLLGLCTSVIELSLEPPDLTPLTHMLDSTEVSIERLSIGRAHEVSHAQWEGLSRSTLWHNLRSIQLLATCLDHENTFHDAIYGLHDAFLSAEPFTRLERLEIVGYVHAESLRSIIDAV